MGGSDPGTVTRILGDVKAGNQQAAHELMTLVAEQLRVVARNQLGRAPQPETLHPTALVNEVYIRLFAKAQPGWDDRTHFFAAAARAMRDIIVDRARRRVALKRGGNRHRITLDEQAFETDAQAEDLLALNDALERLRAADSIAAEVVMLRYFAGLTGDETAAAMNISPSSVDRYWSYAKAWLRREME